MNDPTISISRDSQRVGGFDGFDLVMPFQSYETEEQALQLARTWFASRTDKQPRVVYPKITKLVMRT